MHRKLATATLLAALLAGSGAASAQDFVFAWNPRTGDVWVDRTLGDINDYGLRYRGAFVDELVRYYDAPRDYVTHLLVDGRWAPGDVYYACAIGDLIGRSCQYVAEAWQRDHGEGWGALAQRLGIKPGSPEFHRLKQGFVPTYDRWARPLPLDDALREAFPARERPGNSGRVHTQPARHARPAHADAAGHGRKAAKSGKPHGQAKPHASGKPHGGKTHGGKGQGKPNGHGKGH